MGMNTLPFVARHCLDQVCLEVLHAAIAQNSAMLTSLSNADFAATAYRALDHVPSSSTIARAERVLDTGIARGLIRRPGSRSFVPLSRLPRPRRLATATRSRFALRTDW